jgi:hypothetical protein
MITTEGKCSSCCRAPSAPYRRIVGGVIVEGCIDMAHDATMKAAGPSNTATWHNRPSAKAWRKAQVAHLRAMLGPAAVREILARVG